MRLPLQHRVREQLREERRRVEPLEPRKHPHPAGLMLPQRPRVEDALTALDDLRLPK